MESPDRVPFLERLRQLFVDMDAAYARAAAAAGFDCRGCEDSCCRSLFHHHTFLEFLCLREGFEALPAGERETILAAARMVAASQARPAPDPGTRPMCPLNVGGRCRIYAHRPMICRLHGVEHELHPPGRPALIGSGCREFERCRGAARNGERFDRTPLYARLAALENEFRQAAGLRQRVKLTVAEMLLRHGVLP